MIQFSDRPFHQRFQKLGDEAEGVFMKVYPEGFVKFGLNRPPIALARVPAFVRYTPDFLTAKGLVEVQGFGRDRILKIKLDKLEQLEEWQAVTQWRVDLFLYDSMTQRYAWLRLGDLADLVRDEMGPAAEGTFPEGKPYWAIHVDELPVCTEWTEVA